LRVHPLVLDTVYCSWLYRKLLHFSMTVLWQIRMNTHQVFVRRCWLFFCQLSHNYHTYKLRPNGAIQIYYYYYY